jgi:mitochondrial fission protein ELM1
MLCSNPPLKQTPDDDIRVWLLTGHKPGDNNQLLALAEELGWAYTVKQLVYHSYELLSNRLLGVTLRGINRGRSSPLAPPWPDLVLTAGRRNEPVARWIQQQAQATAKSKVRLVHVGRPWAPLNVFDLIITTPQYFLPERSNILHNQLPLHRVTPPRLHQAAQQWQQRLSHLQRPYTVVLVGGNSGPFVFTSAKGRRFGQLVNQLATARGGSLLVTDSARTPAEAFAAFCAELTLPAYIHRWANGQKNNPYLACLGLADQLVVSGESMSMLAEASVTGKPLYIFDPADHEQPWWRYKHNFRYKPISHRLAMKLGPKRMHRDIGGIQNALIASGRAVWLGDPLPPGRQLSPPDDIRRAADRVRALFADQPAAVRPPD